MIKYTAITTDGKECIDFTIPTNAVQSPKNYIINNFDCSKSWIFCEADRFADNRTPFCITDGIVTIRGIFRGDNYNTKLLHDINEFKNEKLKIDICKSYEIQI